MAAENRAEKAATIEKIYELLGNHKQIILANFTNVGSAKSTKSVRHSSEPTEPTSSSKNTLTKKIIKMRTEGIEEDEFKHLEQNFGGLVPNSRPSPH